MYDKTSILALPVSGSNISRLSKNRLIIDDKLFTLSFSHNDHVEIMVHLVQVYATQKHRKQRQCNNIVPLTFQVELKRILHCLRTRPTGKSQILRFKSSSQNYKEENMIYLALLEIILL